MEIWSRHIPSAARRPLSAQTFPSTYSQTNIRIEYTSQEVYVSKLLQWIYYYTYPHLYRPKCLKKVYVFENYVYCQKSG